MNNRFDCPRCGFINFSTANFCKRCKNSFGDAESSNEGATVNININLNGAKLNSAPQITNQNRLADEQIHYHQLPTSFQSPPLPPQFHNQSNYSLPTHTQAYAPQYAQPTAATPNHGVWRRGSDIVLHLNATLPGSCVRCNESIAGYSGGNYIKQKYRWHNPLVYIALISPLIYVILSLVLSQRCQVNIPLCRHHLDDRQSTKNLMIGGTVLTALLAIFSWSAEYYGFVFLLFLIALIALSLSYEYLYKQLRVSKIENNYIYLSGAHEDFLNRLPYC